MKIKIIDLLNIVSNGEKIPKKIKYRDKIWEYTSTVFGKCYQYYSACLNSWKRLEDVILLEECLNDEVEIIGDEVVKKKIEHCTTYAEFFATDDECNYSEYLSIKINELIDEVNKLNEKMLMAYDSEEVVESNE